MSRIGLDRTRHDFYKILNVSRTSTTNEIKEAYRKLAMILHPDRHDGDEKKTQKFKDISEAYDTLSNESKRFQYDVDYHQDIGVGGFHSNYKKNRKNAARRRPNYRKVYRPVTPPNMDVSFNHKKHFDFHYGDGFLNEEIKKAMEKEKQNIYQSPLGKGFYFNESQNTTGTERDNNNSNETNQNPFSKAKRRGGQGKNSNILFQYEEGYYSEGKETFFRKNTIIKDLHEKRQERHAATATSSDKEQNITQQQPFAAPLHQEESCIVM